MKTTDFAEFISKFFSYYLPQERAASPNTIKSYRDSIIQLIEFIEKEDRIKLNKLSMKHITCERVRKFLMYLEREKHVSVTTRNTRLCAIHSFLQYVQMESIDCLDEIQKILSIKAKKKLTDTITFLTIDGIKALLKQPDTKTEMGRRDLAILALMYDSGCRVQELVDLRADSLHFEGNPTIKICGKGRKTRLVPLVNAQTAIIRGYMKEHDMLDPMKASTPLFSNSRGEKFTRHNIAKILIKYANMARNENPGLIPERISPHVIRHSRAMHLLEAGLNIVYIRDYLGHVSIRTTEIYARADSKSKREALEKAYIKLTDDNVPKWNENETLLDWLESF